MPYLTPDCASVVRRVRKTPPRSTRLRVKPIRLDDKNSGRFMRVQVSARGMDTSGGLRTYVERRLRSGLGRFSNRIIDAPVTITKLKRSHGRFDTRCRIQVRLRGLTQIVVEEVGKDPYIAVDRAADKVRRAVARKLERAREFAPLKRRAPTRASGLAASTREACKCQEGGDPGTKGPHHVRVPQ